MRDEGSPPKGDAQTERWGDREAMVVRDGRDDRGEQEYEIQLRPGPPEALVETLPRARTCTTPTQTALVGQVRNPAQLESVLDRLQSAGVVLEEIHRVEGRSTEAGDDVATYEIRVEGELGASLLRSLRWRHYVVPEQTRVRIAAGSAELLHCLMIFIGAGVSIEQVRRVFPGRPVSCA